ncbi:hypothetical protein CROQUDRAFT_111020 [Cronartium quercuum f. sp. fusiforme G11]|uniref:Uncharacterized protein n=1 Tax=Cronartium quercuum f. sp. fusiforme G11 TaxID=708437 RepID=A0A9P6N6K5_9BASI|nr:hypothetical protein CROQUDRAFT_111020 [Cronartium quercuum f. sp. fusiforme G11]
MTAHPPPTGDDRIGDLPVVLAKLQGLLHNLQRPSKTKTPSTLYSSSSAPTKLHCNIAEYKNACIFVNHACELLKYSNQPTTKESQERDPTSYAFVTRFSSQSRPRSNPKDAPKTRKEPNPKLNATLPDKLPFLTLQQTDPKLIVELKSDLSALVRQVNIHLSLVCAQAEIDVVKIRAIHYNDKTGQINLQFFNLGDLNTASRLENSWCPTLKPKLKIKRRTYPVIIHGINTTFKPNSQSHVDNLVNNNRDALATMVSIRWANQASINEKVKSSVIVHLTYPHHPNNAIRNCITHGGDLKCTEKSQKRVITCSKCLGFNHLSTKYTKP